MVEMKKSERNLQKMTLPLSTPKHNKGNGKFNKNKKKEMLLFLSIICVVLAILECVRMCKPQT